MKRFALLALLALTATPAGADSFRCGTRLITDGATMGEVRARCGEPDAIEHREILRRPTFWRHGRRYYAGDGEVAVPIEFWTYNLGPHRLMRRIRFEDGRVTDIETLEHGYNDPDPRP